MGLLALATTLVDSVDELESEAKASSKVNERDPAVCEARQVQSSACEYRSEHSSICIPHENAHLCSLSLEPSTSLCSFEANS